MLFDGPLTTGTVRARVLLSRAEAQLRYDVLPDCGERQTIREKIDMCDLLLNTLLDSPPARNRGSDGIERTRSEDR